MPDYYQDAAAVLIRAGRLTRGELQHELMVMAKTADYWRDMAEKIMQSLRQATTTGFALLDTAKEQDKRIKELANMLCLPGFGDAPTGSVH